MVLDILALTFLLFVLFSTKVFYARLFGGLILSHYTAAMLTEFGGGNVQPMIRLFCFVVLYLGGVLTILALFSNTDRKIKYTE